MNQQIYETTLFWVLVDRFGDLLASLTPLIVFVACMFWVFNGRNKTSMFALMGSISSLISRLYELFFPGLNTDYSADGLPLIDDHGLNIYFYLHGEIFGYFVVSICLFIYFLGRYRNAKRMRRH